MITIKNEQNCCPQCGSKLKGDKTQGYSCVNQECNFKIYNSQCPDCKKKYWYTDYLFPKVFQLDTESTGMKILLDENSLGFKNITTLTSDHKPECPYCKKENTLSFDGKYSIDRFLITTEKKKKITPEVTTPEVITKKNEPQKKTLVSGTVNFVKPSQESIKEDKKIFKKVQLIRKEISQ